MFRRLRDMFGDSGNELTGPAAQQAGAIPYVLQERTAVFLLITSRRTGRWIFPKGACGGDEDPGDCARREAWEEAGVSGEITGPSLGAYRDRKLRPQRRSIIEVSLFPLHVSEQAADWPEKKDRTRHWATLEEARGLITTPGLLELVERADQQVRAQQESLQGAPASGASHQG